jgi:hypothetical protein
MRISLTGEVTKLTPPATGISKSGDRFLTFVGKNELYEAGIAFVSRETDLLAYPRIEIFFDSDAEKWDIL